jgi:hypothetical protein
VILLNMTKTWILSMMTAEKYFYMRIFAVKLLRIIKTLIVLKRKNKERENEMKKELTFCKVVSSPFCTSMSIEVLQLTDVHSYL